MTATQGSVEDVVGVDGDEVGWGWLGAGVVTMKADTVNTAATSNDPSTRRRTMTTP